MRRSTRVGLFVIACLVGAIFLRAMLNRFGGDGGRPPSSSQPTFPESLGTTAQRRLTDSLSIELRPQAGGSDTIFVTDVALDNRSNTTVTTVSISCDALGDNGAVIGHAAATLPQLFPAHTKTLVTGVALHFTHEPAQAKCLVAGATARP